MLKKSIYKNIIYRKLKTLKKAKFVNLAKDVLPKMKKKLKI